MEDKLKKFVNEHRDEFDMFEPSPALWQTISQELPKPKKEAKVISINFGESASFKANFMFMRIAAAVLLLLGCGITLLVVKRNVPSATGTLAVVGQPSLQRIAPELVEVEAYYTSQINSKKKELGEYDLKVLGLDDQQEIDQELQRLDNSYKQLKEELYKTPNTEKVMGAMIQNLQIRIEVLNRQLEVLQKIEQLQKPILEEPNQDETTNA
ncbi:hypothetical protein [Pontibacter sp. SGAir0037]|uniref:hypothetical protein n=1 Tax=Pontibacter sp. SGAir0037 TaxID=2571030 RepID=UPI0010CD239D|nr:hypothetical protein [Pontibacter sp. SGAir0037]QCR25094.1 hypothetical protein C1N53_14405 [Pontibacter sp. SGAir0037]